MRSGQRLTCSGLFLSLYGSGSSSTLLLPINGRVGGEDGLPVLQPVAGSCQFDDFAAVQQAIDDCGREHLVIQCLNPLRGRFIGCDDDRGLLMERVDQVEERRGFFLFHREQHDVIDGQQIGFQPLVVCCESGHGYVFGPEASKDVLHRDHVSLLPGFERIVNEAGCDVSFTRAGRPHEDQVVGLVEPGKLTQLVQLPFRHAC